jgi:GAF domain
VSAEQVNELKRWVAELNRQVTPGGGDESLKLSRVADMLSKNFSVQVHEVALMLITPDDRFLRFVLPVTLRNVGQVPLTSTNALAARTVRERRPEVINHFAVVPHSSVFEAVPIAEDQRSEAIQKIMSAPLVQERKALGVIQVSRKGRTPGEAGADFTHNQLRELKAIADALSPLVAQSMLEPVKA